MSVHEIASFLLTVTLGSTLLLILWSAWMAVCDVRRARRCKAPASKDKGFAVTGAGDGDREPERAGL